MDLKGGEKVKNRLVSISLAVALVLSVGLVGCAGEYALGITEYTLTVSGTEGGSTVPEFDSVCGEGTEQTIEAIPEPNYRFIGWTGDVDTIADVNAAKTTIIINDNYSITANFHKMPVTYYTLTLAVDGSGSTSPSVGQHTYAAGTVVSITATPAAGYRFVNWTGSVGTVANVIAAMTAVIMSADYSITANFEEGVVTFPDPSVGTTIRGDIGERGYLFPSDVQDHNPFH
jgi:uncharacterized repeat protein (TIGR02543 family)